MCVLVFSAFTLLPCDSTIMDVYAVSLHEFKQYFSFWSAHCSVWFVKCYLLFHCVYVMIQFWMFTHWVCMTSSRIFSTHQCLICAYMPCLDCEVFSIFHSSLWCCSFGFYAVRLHESFEQYFQWGCMNHSSSIFAWIIQAVFLFFWHAHSSVSRCCSFGLSRSEVAWIWVACLIFVAHTEKCVVWGVLYFSMFRCDAA